MRLGKWLRKGRMRKVLDNLSYTSVILDLAVSVSAYISNTSFLYLFSYLLSAITFAFVGLFSVYVVKHVRIW
jgi:hypothetical protein